MPAATLIDPVDRPEEGWDDPAYGSIRWRTLLSRPRTDSDTFTCGIATLARGERWIVHAHAQAEIYLGLSGEFDVEVDGHLHRLAPERLLYIPGDVHHGIPAVAGDVRFFYAFATDGFDDVRYVFPDRNA